MAKGKDQGSDAVSRTADLIGQALGTVAGAIESLQVQHPHPVDEARAASMKSMMPFVRAKRTALKVATRARKAVKRGRKTAKRVARRLKR